MKKYQLNSPQVFEQNKGKYFQAQKQQTAAAFYERPKTMLMVAVETGILRANICRYVAALRRNNSIYLIRKGICEISKHPGVGYYTTNPDLMKGGQHGSR